MPTHIGHDQTRVTLIMPALNEGPNLAWLLPQIVNAYDIILVDNGSSDGTKELAGRFPISYIPCPRKGYGSAVLAGLAELEKRQLRPEIVVVFDADGTSPAAAISTVTSPILKGEADFVIGQRTFKQKGAMPAHADFGNRLTVLLMKILTGYRYQEMGPLRAIRYRSLLDLNMIDRTWGWNVEMQMKAVWQGLQIREVPIEYLRRRYGRSKISGSMIGSLRAGTKILARVAYFYCQYWGQRFLGRVATRRPAADFFPHNLP